MKIHKKRGRDVGKLKIRSIPYSKQYNVREVRKCILNYCATHLHIDPFVLSKNKSKETYHKPGINLYGT